MEEKLSSRFSIRTFSPTYHSTLQLIQHARSTYGQTITSYTHRGCCRHCRNWQTTHP